MSDTEQEWKPNGRPQSTMAQAFSSALDSAFALDSDVDHLAQTIDQKKQMMMIQTLELEQLQARIREAEKRLKARQSVVLDGSNFRRDADQGEESERAFRSTGEDNTTTARSVQASSVSDSRPNAEGSADSSTSRDTSHGREDSSSDEQQQYQQGERRAS